VFSQICVVCAFGAFGAVERYESLSWVLCSNLFVEGVAKPCCVCDRFMAWESGKISALGHLIVWLWSHLVAGHF
jgi:hypothetical protein